MATLRFQQGHDMLANDLHAGSNQVQLGRFMTLPRLTRQAAGGGDPTAVLLGDREALGAALTAAAEAHAAHIDALEDRLATAAVRTAAALVRALPSVQAGRMLIYVLLVLKESDRPKVVLHFLLAKKAGRVVRNAMQSTRPHGVLQACM